MSTEEADFLTLAELLSKIELADKQLAECDKIIAKRAVLATLAAGVITRIHQDGIFRHDDKVWFIDVNGELSSKTMIDAEYVTLNDSRASEWPASGAEAAEFGKSLS